MTLRPFIGKAHDEKYIFHSVTVVNVNVVLSHGPKCSAYVTLSV